MANSLFMEFQRINISYRTKCDKVSHVFINKILALDYYKCL